MSFTILVLSIFMFYLYIGSPIPQLDFDQLDQLQNVPLFRNPKTTKRIFFDKRKHDLLVMFNWR